MTVLTIVTVVRNDLPGMQRTVASIAGQATADVDLVVLDGSDDPAAVPALLAPLGAFDVDCSWAEPKGVYSAMNAGLARVSGEYTYFLNAGDVLAAADVLDKVTRMLELHRPGWAMGRVEFRAEDGSVLAQPPWDYPAERAALFARGRFPAHQAVVVRTDALRAQGGFDIGYRVAADYASILRLAVAGPPLGLHLTLAEFTVGGLSTQDWRTGLREFHRARREVFAPRGVPAALETARTARAWLATSAYRGLWAPGRPLARTVAAIRAAGPGSARR